MILLNLALAAAVFTTAVLLFAVSRAPSLADVRAQFRSSDRAVLDRHQQIIDEVRVEKNVRRLGWVELGQVSPAFIEALLKAEDKRFFYHPGFDPIAMTKAAFGAALGRPLRGASTITMQVAELIEDPSGRRKPRRGLLQKIKQVGKAIVLELKWRKSSLLEAYVNLVHFRGELQGLGAASYGLFDKAPAGLTRPEAAVLAALIRAPNADISRVRERACLLLRRLGSPEDCGFLSEQHLAYIEQGYHIRPFMRLAPHVAKRLANDPSLGKAALIRSTLDRQIQWVAIHSLQKQITAMQSQNMNDGAVVVIENSTGNVLAYVGNIGPASKAPYVDAVVAPRQAGSTLKPLIFGKTLDERILTAASVLEDSPLAIAVTTGVYRPANFDRAFRDLVTVRTALASSLNIPAVRALELLGVENFVGTMQELGFTGLERADFYGPSLALGSADVKLLELANAYRVLANNGLWTPVRFSPQATSEQAPRRVYSPEASFIIKDILSDRQARAATFGLENTLSTRYWSAVKTGTSKDMRDNWCVGFSEKYTVAVWAGNFSGEAMWNVSGVQGAAPVWQEIMNYLHRQETSEAPLPPPGLTQAKVHFSHNQETREEWFLTGTEPANMNIESLSDVRSRFSYPLDQSMIALDPDIPKQNHRVFIQIVAPKGDQNVYLNGRRLGRAKAYFPWEPRAGQYTLELRDSKGRVLDTVKFEVRGRRFAG